MGHGQWRQSAVIAGLLLASCAEKSPPRPTLEDALMATAMPSSICFFSLAAQAVPDPKVSLDRLMECSDHANRALDILAIRCKTLPPTTELSEDADAPVLQSGKPAPDELLVHLCAVFPWQNRPQRLRML
jgi:hypothetical protein